MADTSMGPRDWAAQLEANDGDEVAAAIALLRCSQGSHQVWIDYRAEHPDHPSCCPYCGSDYEPVDRGPEDAFDQKCIDEYEHIIRAIETLREFAQAARSLAYSGDCDVCGATDELLDLVVRHGIEKR